MRKLIGVIAGLIAMVVTVSLVEGAGHWLFPPPPGFDPQDTAQMMALIPLPAKIAVVVAWFLGALAGAWAALAVSRWYAAGWIVVALVIAGGVATLFMIAHPLWMQAAAVVAPLIGGWIATRLPRH